ncbi:MAG: hypothetical protein GEV07_14225 [Streptosporangiales bacterium]|nr:hypothetical protein [Streptosporangiales bacterium]
MVVAIRFILLHRAPRLTDDAPIPTTTGPSPAAGNPSPLHLPTERELNLNDGRREWRIHAAVYAVVMTGLIGLNVALLAATSASFFWFPFPLIGWGIGLTAHYLHAVRWAEHDIRTRQQKIEQLAAR